MEPTSRVAHRTLPAVVSGLVLLLTACGGSAGQTHESPTTSRGWHGCTAAEARGSGHRVVHADLDGDGQADDVRYLRPGEAACAGLVLVDGPALTGATLDGLDVAPRSVRAVALRGSPQRVLVLVAERPHSRGGQQVHVFGSDGKRFGEVTVDGHPLLPFYATDGGGTPVTATCPRRGGVALLTARTHEPPGIVLAWDVERTTYRLDGLRAVRTSTSVVRRAVADPTLRKELPRLYDGSFFADCPRPAAG